MSIKRVQESMKPKGLIYTYSCGHTHFTPQEEVHAYIKLDGPNAPQTCPTCEKA